ERIIDYISPEDTPTLAACSSVSRIFHSICRPRLFRKVSLGDGLDAGPRISEFNRLLNVPDKGIGLSKAPMTVHTRELTIHLVTTRYPKAYEEYWQGELLKAVTSFTAIDTL